jgi:deoxycytidine triphosphate deaminase
MLIVGDNLRQLVIQHAICPPDLYDNTSLKLHLMNDVYEAKPEWGPIIYDQQTYEDHFKKVRLGPQGLVLEPGQSVLACSHETYRMPMGYFGQVQTKGSLARLFTSVHLSDPQVDPGYSGRITLEMTNVGPFTVQIPNRANVAQLYVWKCSTDNSQPYTGRYQSANEPTFPRPPK